MARPAPFSHLFLEELEEPVDEYRNPEVVSEMGLALLGPNQNCHPAQVSYSCGEVSEGFEELPFLPDSGLFHKKASPWLWAPHHHPCLHSLAASLEGVALEPVPLARAY